MSQGWVTLVFKHKDVSLSLSVIVDIRASLTRATGFSCTTVLCNGSGLKHWRGWGGWGIVVDCIYRFLILYTSDDDQSSVLGSKSVVNALHARLFKR